MHCSYIADIHPHLADGRSQFAQGARDIGILAAQSPDNLVHEYTSQRSNPESQSTIEIISPFQIAWIPVTVLAWIYPSLII